MFCVDLVNLLQTLGVDVVVCIYDAFMARVMVMLGVRVMVFMLGVMLVVMLGVRVIVVMLGVMVRVRVNG